MRKIFFQLVLAILLIMQVKAIDIELSSSMSEVTESEYSISDNIVTLSSSTDYTLTGSCSDCQIVVDKGLSTTITLNSINIDNSKSGPFVIKKNANVNLVLVGESTITDKETDENSDDYEGAGIKFKSSSTLTISGTGKLNVIGTIKNGIKGASGSKLTINSGTLNIKAVNNAIAADGSLTINDGTFIISSSEGDGIKSDPDDGDEESEGIVSINGGTFNISTYNDGIQASSKLTITGGSFYIKTFTNGSYSSNFDKDEYSAKGIKCSNDTGEFLLSITGGTFVLDTADDSIHSDGNISITGGTFEISTSDDGIHADQDLFLGKLNADNSLINVNIKKSNEGIEGAYVYIYSGIYNVIASDDGINSAGDTDTECSPGGNGNQPGQGGNQPREGGRTFRRNLRNRKLAECYTFHMYIYGGEIYINAGADGLDANGNIIISGGNITVFGAQRGSDGDPIDMDGSLTIYGGILFIGGNQGMTQITRVASNSQKYISNSGSYSSGQTFYILSDDTTIRAITIPKSIPFIYYTSPDVDSTYKFSSVSGTNSNSGSNPTSSNSTNSGNSNSGSNPTSSNSTNSGNSNSTSSSSDDEPTKILNCNQAININILLLLYLVLLV